MAGKTQVLFILLLLLTTYGISRDIYVATNGAGPSPFGAWENASSNIQWAVNVGTNGDTVWISNGTYYLTNQITVNSNITICGNRGELVVVDGNNASRCFYFTNTVNQNGILSNLFITGGNTNGNGGGVYMYSGQVLDCVFSNNSCPASGDSLFRGGGMYFAKTGTIQRCRFIANIASSNGGGLYAASSNLIDDCSFHTNLGYSGGGMYAASANTMITNCRFTCNLASSNVGGVFLGNAGIIMIGCTIASNYSANRAGGIHGAGLIYNCNISNNIARESGGGAALTTGGIMSNCVVARNQSLLIGNCGGGGIYLGGGTLLYCIIEENTAVYYGGGVAEYSGSMRNCLIRNNRAGQSGGGLRRYYNTMVISSCTIVSNYATVSGGGIYDSSIETFGKYDNCIIYFNKCGADGSGSSSNYYFHVDHVGSTFTNCCFAPELPADITTKSTNSIYADPQFVNWPGGNYHLSKGSPCVNTGVNQDWMTSAVDMDGHRRIDRFSGIVDMGCYEHVPSGTMFGVR